MKIITTDILVIGGGSAGIAAACGASRDNNSVVLIENNNFLGGNATSAEVGTVCGLYHNGNNPVSKYIVDGFGKEFAEKLRLFSNTQPISNREGLHFLPYNVECYKTLCEHLLINESVEFLLGTKMVDIEVSNNAAKSCIVNQGEEVFEIRFSSIIDCSGQSIVSRLASLPLMENSHFQFAALVFGMKDLNISNEGSLNLILIRSISRAISNGDMPIEMKQIHIVPGSLQNGCISFKVSIPLKVTLTKNNISELKKMGIEMIESFIKHVKKHLDIFQKSTLHHIADEVGIRTSYRPIGKYTLTEQDVLLCRKFDNSIANCAWPIEDWNSENGVQLLYLPENDFYQIPSDCLTSPHLSNLFFGGKNISATDRAIASARVMGICFQTGYASGRLAAEHQTSQKEQKTMVAIS